MCSGVVVDVAQMKQFYLSSNLSMVTVGPGITLGEFSYKLNVPGRSRMFPVGHCPSVGIAGYILGGGLSEVSNDLGLGCDNLLEVRMVNANGRKVIANRFRNQNLFWASCGGGGGRLGIVYQMRLKTHPTTRYDSHVGFSATLRDFSLIPASLEWLFSFQEQQRGIVTRSKLFKNWRGNRTEVQILGACLESSTILDCRQRLDRAGFFAFPWIGFSTRLGRSSKEYLEFISTGHVISNPEAFFLTSGASHVLGQYRQANQSVTALSFKYQNGPSPPLDYFEDLLLYFNSTCGWRPVRSCTLVVQNIGSAITSVAPRATPIYGLRLARQWISVRVTTRRGLRAAQITMAALRDYFAPHTLGAFINYEDSWLQNFSRSYYGPNAVKMVNINKRMDPSHVFLTKQSLI
eukprot:CAMPEP_0184677462 /NCGR_PEP_ID=MMETSP0312-20130426/54_1 /TAXON_ID=31354 /ORGANISM="Compsopogon coeruleus, Strain SAG 36.94" /LENGTH=404 /DNA_ID=CAMNT_0027125367 /DNA_START=600 /DNA_END=1814 /DNA_ORIENTATION=+